MNDSWTQNRMETLRTAIRQLYASVQKLQDEFQSEKRRFTLDGHLLGSIGEVVAAYAFDLDLLPSSSKDYDAIYRGDGREVLAQIKLTGGDRSVSFYGDSPPEHVIVMQLVEGEFGLVYNGPGSKMWGKCGKQQKNGQRRVSLRVLRRLDGGVSEESRLRQVREFPKLNEGSYAGAVGEVTNAAN